MPNKYPHLRYRTMQIDVPLPLYEEIERARTEAQAHTLKLGEDIREHFYETLLRLGLTDMERFIDAERLVKLP